MEKHECSESPDLKKHEQKHECDNKIDKDMSHYLERGICKGSKEESAFRSQKLKTESKREQVKQAISNQDISSMILTLIHHQACMGQICAW